MFLGCVGQNIKYSPYGPQKGIVPICSDIFTFRFPEWGVFSSFFGEGILTYSTSEYYIYIYYRLSLSLSIYIYICIQVMYIYIDYIHTYTHTHTQIYIYNYIYIYSFCCHCYLLIQVLLLTFPGICCKPWPFPAAVSRPRVGGLRQGSTNTCRECEDGAAEGSGTAAGRGSC